MCAFARRQMNKEEAAALALKWVVAGSGDEVGVDREDAGGSVSGTGPGEEQQSSHESRQAEDRHYSEGQEPASRRSCGCFSGGT